MTELGGSEQALLNRQANVPPFPSPQDLGNSPQPLIVHEFTNDGLGLEMVSGAMGNLQRLIQISDQVVGRLQPH